MKHIFVINPAAGKTDPATTLLPRLQLLFAGREEELEIYMTTGVGDATRFVRERCAASGGEHLRFYSCGGDGTMNEVLQGLAGCANVAMGIVPCGSGNDYVRNFGEEVRRAFLDMAEQLQAVPVSVDLLSTSLGLGIDICAAGLDAQVAYGIPKFRRLPGCGGTMAYTLSILQVLFSRCAAVMHHGMA